MASMLSVDEALALVIETARPLSSVKVPLSESLGCILAEPVASDIDSPPHDKSIVDGYALRSSDAKEGIIELSVIEQIMAGSVPRLSLGPGQASQIMTGAPIPQGADVVVMLERLAAPASRDRIQIDTTQATSGQNIMRRATSMRRGEVILSAGREIRPIEVGILAEVGREQILVIPSPTIAVLATGNELVPVAQIPASGQIRNSNSSLIAALAKRANATPLELGIARDESAHLHERIALGLEADVLVLSGGVSAGVLDLVPQVLAELGVEQIFHKVSVKPGKPLWFGVRRLADRQTLVFGLPGNPVSSLVSFELFVRPAIARLAGRNDDCLPRVQAALTADFAHRGDRTSFLPAKLSSSGGNQLVEILQWQGSGDLRTLTDADGLAHFSSGDRSYRTGELIEVLKLG
jgi:molybdopterin molybdotransferase